MSLVLPREKEVEQIFSRILSSPEACERLAETFYSHLCDDSREVDPDPQHFAEVLLTAYKNGDVSAVLLELCRRSMFDLLKESYLIPKRFHGKNGENPVLLTDPDGNLLKSKKGLVTKHEYKKFQFEIRFTVRATSEVSKYHDIFIEIKSFDYFSKQRFMVPVPRWPLEIFEKLIGHTLLWSIVFPISVMPSLGFSPDQIDPVGFREF